MPKNFWNHSNIRKLLQNSQLTNLIALTMNTFQSLWILKNLIWSQCQKEAPEYFSVGQVHSIRSASKFPCYGMNHMLFHMHMYLPFSCFYRWWQWCTALVTMKERNCLGPPHEYQELWVCFNFRSPSGVALRFIWPFKVYIGVIWSSHDYHCSRQYSFWGHILWDLVTYIPFVSVNISFKPTSRFSLVFWWWPKVLISWTIATDKETQ